MAALIILGVLGLSFPETVLAKTKLLDCPPGTFPGTEAFASTITLQMPFIAGETWTVGGDGSFYGNVKHCNEFNDYYATDWNRTNDFGAAVLPVADGFVSDSTCLSGEGYGCYVQIDHANGYRTLYAHLSDRLVNQGDSVHTWTLIGRVGNTGVPVGGGSHLHLTFKHNDNGYFSYCWNNGQTCPNTENPQWPQGHRPSPMMTKLGPTTLQDFHTYTSINGRVFLPILRNKDGWVSEIYIRNNGTESRNVRIYYFELNGSSTPKISDTCVLNPRQRCWLPVNVDNRIRAGTSGTAYIDNAENLSVVVTEIQNSELNEYNGIVSADGLLGWEQVGAKLYAPIIKNAVGGRSSRILIMNGSETATTAQVQFYNAATGNAVGSLGSYGLPSRGSTSVTPTECPAGVLCSAKIESTNGVPLAVVIREQTDVTTYDRTTHNAFSIGATRNWVPLIKKNAGGQTTNLAVMNLGTATTTVSITCYSETGSSIACGTRSVPKFATAVFIMNGADGSGLPDGFLGSARISTSPDQPVASLVYETGTPYKLVTNVPLAGSKAAYAPHLYGNYSSNPTWDTGISVQNVSTVSANVTVTYYDVAGNVFGSPQAYTGLGPNRTWILNYGRGNLPGGFSGTAYIQSNQSIVAIVNVANSTPGHDTKASYTVPNR